MSVMTSSRYIDRLTGAGWQRLVGPNAVNLSGIWSRTLDVVAVAGPMVFLATTILLEHAQVDFSPARDTISSLVWGRFGWAQTAAFFMMALSMIAMAVRLTAIMGQGRSARAGQALLSTIGIAFAVIAVFPTSSPLGPSGVQNAVHQQTVRAMSALFPLACVLISNSVRLSYPAVRGYTAATAMIAVALIPAGALATFTDAPWLGAIERIILGNGLLWAEIVAVQVLLVGKHLTAGLGRTVRAPVRPEIDLSRQPSRVLVQARTNEILKDTRRKGNF